ncbi:MAG: GNAT family N-acetyltransferase [Desulfobaccales bacterium]
MAANGEILVSPVQDEAGLQEFLRFPWRIYRQDPYWVPPLLPEQREFLDLRRGPFFEIGEAQYFMAYRRGEPVGRISAHLNRRHDEYHGADTGFWGFFEAVQDQEVANALFEAAAAWLRQRGRSRLVGPLNFSIYDEMGLLIEGFDSMPAMFQTHNPPYYADLVASWGFRKAMDWVALKITDRNVDVPDMERRLNDILVKQKVTLAPYNPRELARRAEEVFQLFNEAWSVNWGHVPLSRQQFDHLLHEVKPLLRPELVHMLLDGDKLVGFGIVLPDLNPVVQKLNGRLSLWGKLRLLYAAKYAPIRKVRAMVIGIAQPYQLKRLNYAIFLRTYIYLIKHTTCDMADFSLIPENLRHWIKVIQAFGGQAYKTFRVFEREI